MNTAKAVKAKAVKAISVLAIETLPNNVRVLITSCADYEVLKTLPQVVSVGKEVFGRSGWNSDKCIAYYRTDVQIATY